MGRKNTAQHPPLSTYLPLLLPAHLGRQKWLRETAALNHCWILFNSWPSDFLVTVPEFCCWLQGKMDPSWPQLAFGATAQTSRLPNNLRGLGYCFLFRVRDDVVNEKQLIAASPQGTLHG